MFKSTLCLMLSVALLISPAVFAETYYFVGGSNPPRFYTASNWATADGTVPASDPDVTAAGGNVFVFTNDEDVVFATGLDVSSHIVKRGAGTVKFNTSFMLYRSGATLTLEEGVFGHYTGNQSFSQASMIMLPQQVITEYSMDLLMANMYK